MLRAALLLAALLGQTVYTWTDADGAVHFTDNRASIPRGVKVKELPSRDAGTVQPSSPAARPTVTAALDAGTLDAGAPPVDTCAKARAAVDAAQASLDAEKKSAAAPRENNCQAMLNTLGPAAYAQCMQASPDDRPQRAVEAAQRKLDLAQDDLRRAKAAGCR